MDISLLTGWVLCSRGVLLCDVDGVRNDTVLRGGIHDNDGVVVATVRLLLNGVEMRGFSAANLDTDFSISPVSLRRGAGFWLATTVVLRLPSNSAW